MAPRGPLRPRLALAVGLAATLLAACATTAPEPVRSPLEVVASARHDLGSALAEADVATTISAASFADDPDPDLALRVTCRFVRLDAVPSDQLEPLAASARLLLGAGSAEPLAAVPRLLRGARVASAPDGSTLDPLVAGLVAARGPPAPTEGVEEAEEAPATRSSSEHGAPLGDADGALPAGTTVALALHGPGGAVRLRVQRLATQAGAEALDVAVELELQDGPVVERERVLLAGPTEGARLALVVVVPSPFVAAASDQAREGVACLLEVGPPPSAGDSWREAHRLAVAACAGDLARARAVAASLARPDAPASSPGAGGVDAGAGSSRAIEALGAPRDQRLALLGLASETGAGLALDVATAGPDELVAAVASRALWAVRRAGDPRGPALGHCLELAAVVELASVADGDDTCDAAVHGLLARATGGLALRPSALLAAGDAGPAEWAAWLRAENLALLEDGDAATRVRAAEWLSDRGGLPTGFDPLGPSDARRAALAAAEGPGP